MAAELYDEIEQGERVKRWIQEYAVAVVLGVALAFGGIFGWRHWQSYQASQGYLVAERYALFQDVLEEDEFDQAQAVYNEMREAHTRHAYTGLAGLEVAHQYVERGRTEEAIDIYREVLANRRLNALHPAVRLRLARLQLSTGDPEAALATLGSEAPVGFGAAFAEVRGDIEYRRGNLDQARLAYQEALDTRSPEAGSSHLLELKLNSLKSAGEQSS